MNNKFKILIIIFIILLYSQCNTLNKKIFFKQTESSQFVIIRFNLKYKKITGFKFPNKLEIINNSLSDKSIINIKYLYKDSLTNRINHGIELFKIDKEVTRILNNKKKTIHANTGLNLFYYTRHYVDSTKNIQMELKPYIKKC